MPDKVDFSCCIRVCNLRLELVETDDRYETDRDIWFDSPKYFTLNIKNLSNYEQVTCTLVRDTKLKWLLRLHFITDRKSATK